MEQICEVCGGTPLAENGITVCSECGLPFSEEPQELFVPLSSAYERLRAGDFCGAGEEFSALLHKYPDCARVYWGILLCRNGVLYEKRGNYTFPVCTLLRRKRIFDDSYCRRALARSEGRLYEYYKYEAMRIENARRSAAYQMDCAKKKHVDYYAYEALDDVVYERDVAKKKKNSWVGPLVVVLALVAIAAGVLMILLGVAEGKKSKDSLSIQFKGTPTVYSGQSVDALRPFLDVVYTKKGVSALSTDYAIEGTLKAGKCTIIVSYEGLSAVCEVEVLGVDGTEGLTYRSVKGGAEVASYTGTESEVVIPYYYEGLPVVSIGEGAFFGKQVTEVSLHKNILSIGNSAFSGASLLSASVPSSVLEIGEGAYRDCKQLTSVRVDAPVLGEAMFASCSSLTSVDLQNGMTAIPSSSFAQCSALYEIRLPSSVKQIGSYAFAACTGLRVVYFPMSLELIDVGAFSYIGEVSFPHFEGVWDAVVKVDGWCENTTFGPFMDY